MGEVVDLHAIDRDRTALLFFDLLNGHYHAAPPATKARLTPMVDNAVRLLAAGRETGLPVFFARGHHRPDSATTALLLTDTNNALIPWPGGVVTKGARHVVGGEASSEVIPELAWRPGDYDIPKYRWSAFYQTALDLSLRARGIDTVILSGGSTDVGIASTLFAGRDLDYHMIVVRDACATAHDQRAHDVLMDLVFPRMARVRTTAEVLEMIRRAGGRPGPR